jgi:threonine dehydrogenase-like Zn-dependent dehydrogenase
MEVPACSLYMEGKFDLKTDLDHIQEAYIAMDERKAIKVLLKVSDL